MTKEGQGFSSLEKRERTEIHFKSTEPFKKFCTSNKIHSLQFVHLLARDGDIGDLDRSTFFS